MEILQDRSIKTIVVEKDEEVIIMTNNKTTGYVSIYNNGEYMIIDDINKKESEIPYLERHRIAKEKAQIRKEKLHQAYLDRKANKK